MINKTIYHKKTSLFVFLSFLIGIFSFSQQISTSVDTLKIKIGEPIEYLLQLHNQNDNRIISALKAQLKKSKVELNSYSIDSTSSQNIYSYKLILTSFEEGNQQIPSFKLPLKNDTLLTSSYQITVLKTEIDDKKSFHDIKNIEEVPITFVDYLNIYKFYILAFLIILILIVALIYFFKKRKNKTETEKIVTLNERIQNRITLLKEKKYLESEKYKDFYVELSEILRDFTAERFNIPAKILLTNDLIDFIGRKKIISATDLIIVKDILNASDMVKFAKFKPTKEIGENHLIQTSQFIENSMANQEVEELQIELQKNDNHLKIRKI